MEKAFPGEGRKRKQLDVNIEKIFLDPKNPRLRESDRGKPERELLIALYKDFDLKELSDSFSQNGYFDEEPLVLIPKDLPEKFQGKSYEELKDDESYFDFLEREDTRFIVAEGNRRVSTIKIMLSEEIRERLKIKDWETPSEQILEDLKIIPAIIYPSREDVIPYLGVRHIVGIKKWDPYAKARYIAEMIENGMDIGEVQKKIGDKGTSAAKSYASYKLIDIMEGEEEGSGEKAKSKFSYLLLSLGQGAVKDYLGIPKKWQDVDMDNLISSDNLSNLRNLFSFLYGEGKEKGPVINESRDITNLLIHILRKPDCVNYLITTRNLQEAYDRSDGEEELILKNLANANRMLESSLGMIHRHATDRVIEEVNKCKDTISELTKVMEE